MDLFIFFFILIRLVQFCNNWQKPIETDRLWQMQPMLTTRRKCWRVERGGGTLMGLERLRERDGRQLGSRLSRLERNEEIDRLSERKWLALTVQVLIDRLGLEKRNWVRWFLYGTWVLTFWVNGSNFMIEKPIKKVIKDQYQSVFLYLYRRYTTTWPIYRLI